MDSVQLVSTLSGLAHQAGEAVENKISTENMTNPEVMLKTQFAMQQYSAFINYSSAMLKMIKDMISGIIAKI